MLGRPKWFKRRKYGGWGYCPKCWQGWVYVASILAPFLLLQVLPFGSDQFRLSAIFVWGGVVLLDALHIMVNLDQDERERVHEAVAERNALWVMIVALCAGAAYQVSAGVAGGGSGVDPVILAALFAGVAAKAATNIYLDHKD